MIRKLVLLLWAMALLLGLASVAPAAEPIKIGLILPMTGPAAAYGDMAYKGIQMAQAKRPEVLGRPVKLLLMDNKSEKVESSNAANRLIQRDKVALIIGALSSTPTMAAAPVAEDAGVPLVSGWATNPLVTKKKKYIFRTCFIDPFQGAVAARFAFDTLRARKAAVLIDISRDYSMGLASFFIKAFKKLGGKIVARAMYSHGDQEFSAQLGMIKKRSPDLIYLPGYLPELPLIVRQARKMGLEQPFLGGDSAQADEVVKIGGKAVEGFYLTTHFDEQGVTTPAGKSYASDYRKKHNKAPDALGALGYDAYNVVLDALAKAGSTDPAKVTKAMEATKGFAGVCGVMDIVEHNAVKPVVVLTVDKGRFKYVTTVKP
ncbi:MAG: ABC transporter substrate-binding protein [Desulfarculaceae bacterium]|nr:ABC transporter substrate-binding protein [Desulfarculaceae bacterium]MCF8073888.1 ABC transporter substrate-binding protein [Desulfarculaceae bacterium]MCF8102868.1 ABC transporter substrate-binding protein [Desulfarculaceae bacterium]MCF8116312.1 ABC transporter substrate-binding protein [Desulfarculaceae bacterium]